MRKNYFSATISHTFKMLIIVFITIIFSGNSYSQNNERTRMTPEEKASKMADRMKQNLSLSDDQYKQVYSIALEKARMHISNTEKYKSLDKETRKEMKKQERSEFRKQLEGILSQDQITKMKELRESHKGNRDGHKSKKSRNKDQVK